MIDQRLINYMHEELQRTPLEFKRYMYDKILWHDRLVGLVGPRGVGKSTMVKQYLLQSNVDNDWMYVSADHSYFNDHSLSEFADEFMKDGGKHLIIDEIHKLPNWSQTLKEIYDSHSQLQVIFTGSSILDIKKGMVDLSRRALIFEMQGLSFREYLTLYHKISFPVYSMTEILEQKIKLPIDFHPLPLFRRYLKEGYYPFSHLPGYDIRLQQIISQTIEVDIPAFAGLNQSTTRKLKKLLSVISSVAPFKPSVLHLASELKISKNDVSEYMLYLEKAGMLAQVRDDTHGMRGVGKVEKVFVDNTNLMYALVSDTPNIGTQRETFFFNQMRVNNDVMTSKKGDFRINDYVFEVGGKNKGWKQISEEKKGIVVKDDIEFGQRGVIPLWHFGLNY
ncbi:MAG: ATP-binding protein [Muribaculaceae bacterium]|nr:ATP-binding protein [Muribaculaceae bacterium]